MVKIYKFLFFASFLGAGAVLSQEEENQVVSQIPVGADFYLSNNVGAGTVFSAYQQQPMVASSLYVYPYYKFGPFWGDRELKVHAELSTAFEWLGAGNPFPGKFTDKFSLGDLKIRAELKKALQAKDLGLSFAPGLKLEAPLSKGSRVANRMLGLGGFFNATWSKWGLFLTYKPVALGYMHTAPYKSDACGEEIADDDKLGGGACKVAGRQTMVMWKNGFFAGYSGESHTATLGFRTYHSFLRAQGRGEKADKAPTSDIMEATLGFLEYAYALPVSVPTSLILGVSSYQSPYDASGSFRVPFFDFTEPAKNLTEAYVAVNVTI